MNGVRRVDSRRVARMVLACALALFVIAALAATVQVEQAQAATNDKVVSYAKSTGGFKKASMGKTAGKTGGKALTSIKIEKKGSTAGKVSYTVGTRPSGTAKGKDGSEATKNGKAIQYISVKLSGKLKSTYNVWYRVYAKGYGWLGWAKNGAKAGSTGCDLDVTAYQVKLVGKKDTQPNTDRKAFSNKKGFLASISGDKTADKQIKKVFKKYSKDDKGLKKAFQWCANKINYGSTGLSVIRTSGSWQAKRIKQEAKLAFVNKRGDCYTYAAAFYCAAKYFGYNARPMAGTTPNTDGQTLNTSWTEVKIGGAWMVCDPLHAYQNVYMKPQSEFKQSYQHYK